MAAVQTLIQMQRVRMAGLTVTGVESTAVLIEKLTGFDAFPDAVDIALCVVALVAWVALGINEIRERSFAETLGDDVAELEVRRGREKEATERQRHQHDRVENLLEGQEYPTIGYRPVFELETQQVVGLQAAVHYGPGPSEPWLRQAEMLGLRNRLEVKAARRALEILAERPEVPFVIIPCSLSTLADRGLMTAIDHSDPARVVVELTDGENINDYTPHRTTAEILRRRGVRLSVGHDATGHTALRHIVELKSEFIRLRHSSKSDSEVISTLISLATLVRASVIADGVDDDGTRQEFGSMGAHLGLGNLVVDTSPTSDAVADV